MLTYACACGLNSGTYNSVPNCSIHHLFKLLFCSLHKFSKRLHVNSYRCIFRNLVRFKWITGKGAVSCNGPLKLKVLRRSLMDNPTDLTLLKFLKFGAKTYCRWVVTSSCMHDFCSCWITLPIPLPTAYT